MYRKDDPLVQGPLAIGLGHIDSQASRNQAGRSSDGKSLDNASLLRLCTPTTLIDYRFSRGEGSSPNSVGSEHNKRVGVGCTVAAGSQGQARCAHRSADAARPWTALRHRADWPLRPPAAQSVLFGTTAST